MEEAVYVGSSSQPAGEGATAASVVNESSLPKRSS